MAISTQSILPFPVTSIPDRLTALYVEDRTVATTTAGTGALKRLNRIQSASFTESVPITEVTEMGAQFRVGGVTELGEVKFKIDASAVSVANLAALTGVTVSTAPGSTTSIGLTNFQSASADIFRLVADPTNKFFGTMYIQGAIITDYNVDVKEKTNVTEGVQGMAPVAFTFPGFIVPKVYVATAGDVTALNLSVAGCYGADEQPVALPLPKVGVAPSYISLNGMANFLKIEKLPGGSLTAATTLYFEYVVGKVQTAITASTTYCTPSTFIPQLMTVGQKVDMGVGTANVETVTITAVASQVNTNSGASLVSVAGSATITPASMQGIYAGVTLTCANTGGTNSEVISVTSTTSTTFTATFASTKTAGFTIASNAPSFQATFTKPHALNDPINPHLAAAQNGQGYAAFIGGKLYIGDTIVAGDAYRLTFCTYNTDSYPLTVPQTTPDTAERAGVSARLVPIQINALGVNRCTSAAFKFSFKRDQVQGLGENKTIYGVPSIPNVDITLDFHENDLSLLSQFKTGSKNLTALGGTIDNDFVALPDISDRQLAVAYPVSITLGDPLNAGNVLCTYSSPQLVIKDIDYSSTNKADNSIKVTAMDITGNFTVSSTVPN